MKSSRDSSGNPQVETGRVEAFSDGVFAIVITLLALDLKIPDGHGSVAAALGDQWASYLAYLTSFAYAGVIWVNHHQLFTRIRRVSTGLLWRNLALLLATSVLPFPTAVVSTAFRFGGTGNERTALLLYAGVAGTAVATWLALFHYLAHRPDLLEHERHAAFFAAERWRALVGLAGYALCAAVSFASAQVGLIAACCLPVFYGLTSGGMRRGQNTSAVP